MIVFKVHMKWKLFWLLVVFINVSYFYFVCFLISAKAPSRLLAHGSAVESSPPLLTCCLVKTSKIFSLKIWILGFQKPRSKGFEKGSPVIFCRDQPYFWPHIFSHFICIFGDMSWHFAIRQNILISWRNVLGGFEEINQKQVLMWMFQW